MCRAGCNTDHRMLRMKLIVGRKRESVKNQECRDGMLPGLRVVLKARGRETARGSYLRCG